MNKKIIIAGGSGLIGSHISDILIQKGYQVGILTRSPQPDPKIKEYKWDISTQEIQKGALEDAVAVINLTGAGIADKRWTESRKEVIVKSRTNAAKTIKKYLDNNQLHLKSYISASAIGYYGDSGKQLMTESDDPTESNFLVNCCKVWEESADTVAPFCDNLAKIRIGIVLDDKEGALGKMLLPFFFGSAAYFGDGSQYYSWIHIQDVAKMFVFALEQGLSGTYNGVSPNPITNKELVENIKKVKNGFSILHPVPKFALQIALGEMSSVVLNSNLISSQKIESTGFEFQFPTIQPALENLLQ